MIQNHESFYLGSPGVFMSPKLLAQTEMGIILIILYNLVLKAKYRSII